MLSALGCVFGTRARRAGLAWSLQVPSAVPSRKKKVGPGIPSAGNGPRRPIYTAYPHAPPRWRPWRIDGHGASRGVPPPILQPPSNTFPSGCLYTTTVLEVAAPSRSTFAGSRHLSYRMAWRRRRRRRRLSYHPGPPLSGGHPGDAVSLSGQRHAGKISHVDVRIRKRSD